jgi:hypothetical protein
MRRQDPPVPEKLCRFVAAEWPDEDPFGAWCKARLGFVSEYPDTVLGDVLAEHRRLRREAASLRPLRPVCWSAALGGAS